MWVWLSFRNGEVSRSDNEYQRMDSYSQFPTGEGMPHYPGPCGKAPGSGGSKRKRWMRAFTAVPAGRNGRGSTSRFWIGLSE